MSIGFFERTTIVIHEMNENNCLYIFFSWSGDLQRKLITFDCPPDVIASIIATLCKVFHFWSLFQNFTLALFVCIVFLSKYLQSYSLFPVCVCVCVCLSVCLPDFCFISWTVFCLPVLSLLYDCFFFVSLSDHPLTFFLVNCFLLVFCLQDCALCLPICLITFCLLVCGVCLLLV